eukprot:SAG25_NODE_236_length_11287_cov_246.398999_1_plen_47_part_00
MAWLQVAYDVMKGQYDKHRTFMNRDDYQPGKRVWVSSSCAARQPVR